jgi:RimJ/RimL family protein N-acetyltransferase
MVAFDIAFGQLGLKELRNQTVATNRQVLSISRKFGFKQIKVEVAGRTIGGQPVDMVHFILTAGDWAKTRESLMATAERRPR